MKAALGALVLVLVAACSSGGGAPSAEPSRQASGSATSAPAGDPAPKPRPRLEAAQLALSRAAGAAYTLRVVHGLTDPFIAERGHFDVQSEVVNLRRTIHLDRASGQDGRQVMRIRSSPRSRFLQLEGWGSWDGCWAEFGPGLPADQGIDLRGLPNLPVPVSLVLDARLSPGNVSPTSGPMAGRAAVLTDGFTALQMLGFDGTALVDLPLAVARVEVPAHLMYFAEHPEVVESVEIYGGEVVEAFRNSRATLPDQLRTALGYRSATATFSPADEPVRFARPPARQLLPPGATANQTCAAHGGPAQNITVENVAVSRKPTRV